MNKIYHYKHSLFHMLKLLQQPRYSLFTSHLLSSFHFCPRFQEYCGKSLRQTASFQELVDGVVQLLLFVKQKEKSTDQSQEIQNSCAEQAFNKKKLKKKFLFNLFSSQVPHPSSIAKQNFVSCFNNTTRTERNAKSGKCNVLSLVCESGGLACCLYSAHPLSFSIPFLCDWY